MDRVWLAQEPSLSSLPRPFWECKSLSELSTEEWESLCDGCGRCCLNKLEDEDTGEIFFTRAACYLLDIHGCCCTQYLSRQERVPTCMSLGGEFHQFHWLPRTCAYRLRHENQPLPDWHPLVSKRPDTVHEAGISVRHIAISETEIQDLLDHVLEDFG